MLIKRVTQCSCDPPRHEIFRFNACLFLSSLPIHNYICYFFVRPLIHDIPGFFHIYKFLCLNFLCAHFTMFINLIFMRIKNQFLILSPFSHLLRIDKMYYQISCCKCNFHMMSLGKLVDRSVGWSVGLS